MTIDEAIKWFGSGRKLCYALKLTGQSITYWKKIGKIPESNQLRIQQLTNGELIADDLRSLSETAKKQYHAKRGYDVENKK